LSSNNIEQLRERLRLTQQTQQQKADQARIVKQEKEKETKTLKASKYGTKGGKTHTNVHDAQKGLTKFLKDTNKINTTQAKNYTKIQANNNKQLATIINTVEGNTYKAGSGQSYYSLKDGTPITSGMVDQWKNDLADGKTNLVLLKAAVKQGEANKPIYNKIIKQLEEESIKPHPEKAYTYKTSPSKKDKELNKILNAITAGPPSELNVTGLGRVAQQYERVFTRVTDALTDAIKNAKTQAAQAKTEEKPLETIIWYGLAETTTGGRGAFNALTFTIRPKQWEESAKTINALLTPRKNESVKDYEERIKQIVAGDIDDPVLRKKMINQLLSTMPMVGVSDEQIETGKKYRAVLVDTILSDPISFVAEVSGGLAGGWLAGQVLSKVPSAIRKLTPKSLERKAFEKLHSLEAGESPGIDITGHKLDGLPDSAVAQIESAMGQNPARSLGKGKWNKIQLNHWVPQNRRGSTSIVVLMDPLTKTVKGFLTLQEAQAITGGAPELLATIGGLQAFHMVYVDPTVSAKEFSIMQQLHKNSQAVIPASALKQLNPNDEILETLLSLGIIVIPDLSQVEIQNTGVAEAVEQTPIQTNAQAQLQIPEITPTQVPELEKIPPTTPPIKLSLEDQKKRRDMDRKFYTGPKSIYRVTYTYLGGKKQSVRVEARSILEAMQKAQRAKAPNRKPWIMIDIEKVKG